MVKANASGIEQRKNSRSDKSGGRMRNVAAPEKPSGANGHSLLPPDHGVPNSTSAKRPSRRKPRVTHSDEPLPTPFTIIYDQREGIPYTFTGLRADADKQNRPLAVEIVKGHLETGDYSIVGCERQIVVERKSLDDLYSTLGQNRMRFEREHERMAEIVASGGFACVVIEASLRECLLSPPDNSKLDPKVVDRTRLSWMQRYNVPWLFEDGRRRAEVTTFRMLEIFWRHQEERRRDEERQRQFEAMF